MVEDNDKLDAADGFRANKFRGRTSSAHAALNLNVGGGLGFELGVMADKKNTGVRPVVSFGMSGFSVKLGVEEGKNAAGQKVSGAGLTVGTTMAGAGLNLNFASGKVGGVKGESFGVNATFGPAGVGYILDKTGSNKDNIFYAAYSLPLFETGATITPAVSYAKGTNLDKLIGLRVRVNYAF